MNRPNLQAWMIRRRSRACSREIRRGRRGERGRSYSQAIRFLRYPVRNSNYSSSKLRASFRDNSSTACNPSFSTQLQFQRNPISAVPVPVFALSRPVINVRPQNTLLCNICHSKEFIAGSISSETPLSHSAFLTVNCASSFSPITHNIVLTTCAFGRDCIALRVMPFLYVYSERTRGNVAL